MARGPDGLMLFELLRAVRRAAEQERHSAYCWGQARLAQERFTRSHKSLKKFRAEADRRYWAYLESLPKEEFVENVFYREEV